MPATKDNICKKSTQFHFVNDYLYKTIDDEGNDDNSSLIYADRYYPDGYEPGVPFDMTEVTQPPQNQYQPYNRRQPTTAPVVRQRPQQQQRRPNLDRPNKVSNDYRQVIN